MRQKSKFWLTSKKSKIESKNKIGTYALINMTSNIKWNNNIHFSIGVDNLADYTNVDYGPYIGRKIYFQISLQDTVF